MPGIVPRAVPSRVRAEYLAKIIESFFFGADSIKRMLTAGLDAVEMPA